MCRMLYQRPAPGLGRQSASQRGSFHSRGHRISSDQCQKLGAVAAGHLFVLWPPICFIVVTRLGILSCICEQSLLDKSPLMCVGTLHVMYVQDLVVTRRNQSLVYHNHQFCKYTVFTGIFAWTFFVRGDSAGSIATLGIRRLQQAVSYNWYQEWGAACVTTTSM